MVEVPLIGRRYNLDLYPRGIDKTCVVQALVDTGSSITVLAKSDLKVLYGKNLPWNLDEYFDTRCVHVMTDSYGANIVCVPFIIEGCMIEGMRIDRFYCVVPQVEKTHTILGMDFISACNVAIRKGKELSISTFDNDAFEDNFKKICFTARMRRLDILHKV